MSWRERIRMSAAAGLTAVACVPATAGADETIRPGDLSSTGCTLGFVFDGLGAHAGRTYVTIAAHCVAEAGQPVGVAGTDGDPLDWTGLNDYEPLGHVVVPGEALEPKFDVALVEVLPAVASRVRSGLRGHEDWPTRVAAAADLEPGDALQHDGWGTATFATEQTRQNRLGVYRGEDDGAWQAITSTSPGDSGGPVIHAETGAAVGTVKGKRCGEETVYVCGTHGPTVPSTVQLAARHGIAVIMRAAGEAPPPGGSAPSPPPPAEPPAPPPGPAASCSDTEPPASGLTSGASRLRLPRLRLAGWARDGGCGGAVAAVDVAVARAAGAKCRFVTASGRLLAARSCERPVWRRASGSTRWRLGVRVRRPGRYRVLTRAVDVAGNRQPAGTPTPVRVR